MINLKRIAGAAVIMAVFPLSACAELIWGEVVSVQGDGSIVTVRNYDEWTGSIEEITLKVPGRAARHVGFPHGMKAGDEILVRAEPDAVGAAWEVRAVHFPGR